MTDKPESKIPFSIAAEEALLGAILLNPDCYLQVALIITPRCFFRPQNQTIFNAIAQMHDSQTPIDTISLQEFLKEHNLLKQVGGAVYLDQLLDNVPISQNIERYANIIQQLFIRREIMKIGKWAYLQAQESPKDIDKLIDELVRRSLNVNNEIQHAVAKPFCESIPEYKEKYLKEIIDKESGASKPEGYKTGYQCLDDLISFTPGSFGVIAARPSVGKTALAIDASLNVAKAGGKVFFISLEMSWRGIVNRMLARMTGVNSRAINSIMRRDNFHTIEPGFAQLADLDYILTTKARTLYRIKNEIRRFNHRLGGLDLVIIDYYQIIRAGKYQKEYDVLKESSMELRDLARDTNVPIFVMVQINRMGDDKPQMRDAKGCGQIEQDADVFLILHEDKKTQNEIEVTTKLQVAKNRDGSRGEIELHYRKDINKFVDLEAIPDDSISKIPDAVDDDDISEYDD